MALNPCGHYIDELTKVLRSDGLNIFIIYSCVNYGFFIVHFYRSLRTPSGVFSVL